MIVDASGFAYRAFAVGSPIHRPSDGEPIGAVLGFMALIWRLRGAAEADSPTHAVAAFDPPGKTFRHDLYPAYKGKRPAARRVELEKQLAIMRSAADVLGLVPVEKAGFEADDTIITLATRARAAGMRTTIVSSDKDFSQAVEDGWIEIVDPVQKRRILEDDVIKRFGVPPCQVAEVQALAGDSVDGIPGIPGVGLDKAAKLIRRFGSLEGVLEHASECRWPQVRAQLRRRADDARLFLKLTTLCRDVPIEESLEDFRTKRVDKAHILEICRALEAPAWALTVFETDPQLLRSAEAVVDALEWWREEIEVPGQTIPETPQCGFYKRKLVKDGLFAMARIWRDPETDFETGKPTGRDILRCEVDGKPRDPLAEWTRLSMHPISEAEYLYEAADTKHAKMYRPNDPKGQLRKPVDFKTIPTPTYKRSRRPQ